ncbi:hypothetical protein OS493_019123 [Desmophyllum pertusum]|uniref:Uncharacterized protein n=1 Tax=Desmophyllum pertusum TaxID=174260 RepID=A0A9W9YN51_9CNID|nr:hypothetical protein OS493_019123 [Desmophyllum pertusum]
MALRMSRIVKRRCRRISLRRCALGNRSKAEKVKESSTLRLNEKQIEATRNKAYKDVRDGPRLRVLLHDIRVSGQGSAISLPTKFPSGGSIKLHNCQKYLLKELSTEETDQLECQTPVSETIADDNSPKGKCDNDLQNNKSTNLKAATVKWQELALSVGKETHGCVSEGPNIAIDKDQYSPSPPSSPLYDMPPPSTPAQKQARRAKRLLQLERWKKIEASRSRQERYLRRGQEKPETMQRSVPLDMYNGVRI